MTVSLSEVTFAKVAKKITVLSYTTLDKVLVSTKKRIYIFLDKNVCCGYSLEVSPQGASMSTHNISFCREMRKLFS